MTVDERRTLVERLMQISGSRAMSGPARPVELTLVVQSDVRPWRYPPCVEFQYGEWLRADYERGAVPEPAESADLTTVLAMARQAGRDLLGPPIATLLDPVPAADLRRASLDSLPELLVDLETDRNVVLTLARMWFTLATTEFAPKDVAADWALERLPAELHRPVTYARDWYLGRAPDAGFEAAGARALAAHVVARVEALDG